MKKLVIGATGDAGKANPVGSNARTLIPLIPPKRVSFAYVKGVEGAGTGKAIIVQ